MRAWLFLLVLLAPGVDAKGRKAPPAPARSAKVPSTPDIEIVVREDRCKIAKLKVGGRSCPAWTNGYADDDPKLSWAENCRKGKSVTNTTRRGGSTPLGRYVAEFENSAQSDWLVPYSFSLRPLFQTRRGHFYIHSNVYTRLPTSKWVEYRSAGCPVVQKKCMELIRAQYLKMGRRPLLVEVRPAGPFGS